MRELTSSKLLRTSDGRNGIAASSTGRSLGFMSASDASALAKPSVLSYLGAAQLRGTSAAAGYVRPVRVSPAAVRSGQGVTLSQSSLNAMLS
jgi:hypothetical protein